MKNPEIAPQVKSAKRMLSVVLFIACTALLFLLLFPNKESLINLSLSGILGSGDEISTCSSKAGLNLGMAVDGFDLNDWVGRAGSYRMDTLMGIVDSKNDLGKTVQMIKESNANGIRPVIRMCHADTSCDDFKNPADAANFVKSVHAELQSGEEFTFIAGPNEPNAEKWVSPGAQLNDDYYRDVADYTNALAGEITELNGVTVLGSTFDTIFPNQQSMAKAYLEELNVSLVDGISANAYNRDGRKASDYYGDFKNNVMNQVPDVERALNSGNFEVLVAEFGAFHDQPDSFGSLPASYAELAANPEISDVLFFAPFEYGNPEFTHKHGLSDAELMNITKCSKEIFNAQSTGYQPSTSDYNGNAGNIFNYCAVDTSRPAPGLKALNMTTPNVLGTENANGLAIQVENSGGRHAVKLWTDLPSECGVPADTFLNVSNIYRNSNTGETFTAGSCQLYLTGNNYPRPISARGNNNGDLIGRDGFSIIDLDNGACMPTITINEAEEQNLEFIPVISYPHAFNVGNSANCPRALSYNCAMQPELCKIATEKTPEEPPACPVAAGPSTSRECIYFSKYYEEDKTDAESCEDVADDTQKSKARLGGNFRVVQGCDEGKRYLYGSVLVTEQVTRFPFLNHWGGTELNLGGSETGEGSYISPYQSICSSLVETLAKYGVNTNLEHDGIIEFTSPSGSHQYRMPKLGNALGCMHLLNMLNPASDSSTDPLKDYQGFVLSDKDRTDIEEAIGKSIDATEKSTGKKIRDLLDPSLYSTYQDAITRNRNQAATREILPGEPRFNYQEVNYCQNSETPVNYLHNTDVAPYGNDSNMGPEQVVIAQEFTIDLIDYCNAKGSPVITSGGANMVSYFCECPGSPLTPLTSCTADFYNLKGYDRNTNQINPASVPTVPLNRVFQTERYFTDLPNGMKIPGALSAQAILHEHIERTNSKYYIAPKNGIKIDYQIRIFDPNSSGIRVNLANTQAGAIVTQPFVYGSPANGTQSKSYQFIVPIDYQPYLIANAYLTKHDEESTDYYWGTNKEFQKKLSEKIKDLF